MKIMETPLQEAIHQDGSPKKKIEDSRLNVSKLVNCDKREIVWTSGATESNNLAIKGLSKFYIKRGKHIIITKTEHKAVIDTCKELERDGFDISYLNVSKNGLIKINNLIKFIKKDTIIISIMLVNNEIGVIQNISSIGNLCKKKNIFFHVDAAQATGKVLINLKKINVDLMSFSAHKTYGPKGIGALYIKKKPRIRLSCQIHGGGHERGFRSGTLATHQIIGMGEAFKIAKIEMKNENIRIYYMRNILWKELSNIKEVYLNGSFKHRIPHNLNISLNYIEGESLIMSMKELAVSSGSACTSASLEPSYVLKSIGRSDELSHSSIRFTLGRYTSKDDIIFAIKLIKDRVDKLRNMSPLWEMAQEGIDIEKIKWNHI